MKAIAAYTNRLGNRSSNQDRCLVLKRDNGALLAVADGMGGHPRGDLAAQVTVDSLQNAFLRHDAAIGDPRGFLKSALESAHLDVIEAGNNQQPPIVPRTTCVVCLVQENEAWWAHVGDSRLYLLRDGQIRARTRDHTPVEELLQSGAITEDQLRTHPLRNSVSRCLGGAPRFPAISFDHAVLSPDDLILLCSDGFWSAVPTAQLSTIPRYGNLERAVNQLADEAEMASYPQSDNISLVCLRWLASGNTLKRVESSKNEAPERPAPADAKDPVQQAIEDIHRAMLEYAAEIKK